MIKISVLFLLALTALGCLSSPQHRQKRCWFGCTQEESPVNDGDHLEAIEAQLENLVCPTAGPTTCAQSDLHSFFNGQYANKLCNFVCPNVASLNPTDPNSGYVCHDTNHQTKQYDWCCKSPGKTIPMCTEREPGPPLDLPIPETVRPQRPGTTCRTRRCNQEERRRVPGNNGDRIEAIEAQFENLVCPTAGPTTCAQSDLHSFWNRRWARKICNFVCPNVASLNPNDPNSGYVCHDTNDKTRQYDWCCKSPGKTIQQCTGREPGPPLGLDERPPGERQPARNQSRIRGGQSQQQNGRNRSPVGNQYRGDRRRQQNRQIQSAMGNQLRRYQRRQQNRQIQSAVTFQ